MIHLINMCNKFVALCALMDKLSDPEAKIDPDDLHCFDFREFKDIPVQEDLFWALRNLADQVDDLFTKREGTQWYEYDERLKTRERLNVLERLIKRIEAGQKCPAPWEI